MTSPPGTTRLYTALTERERSILMLAAQGLLTKEIARVANEAPKTVKDRLYTINQKLGTSNRIEAIAAAVRFGEIPCPYCDRQHRFSRRATATRKRQP